MEFFFCGSLTTIAKKDKDKKQQKVIPVRRSDWIRNATKSDFYLYKQDVDKKQLKQIPEKRSDWISNQGNPGMRPCLKTSVSVLGTFRGLGMVRGRFPQFLNCQEFRGDISEMGDVCLSCGDVRTSRGRLGRTPSVPPHLRLLKK
ncbi:uncharacterized protein LOC131030410 [Cryptomeria japonica]|uniref:uncharacterized protein LOC131030410 n=1 Tax=Cryptomeria japonica TaxID=3369 RepID=UPI0025AC2B88|nr:uncharacterized protein LOC131030410 [Cryptomeria japonica]